MANYKLYEYFGDASGNDDFLSDIGNTEEVRYGMWAWTPYGVSDGTGVVNENVFTKSDSLQWHIPNNMEYAGKMANAAAGKLNIRIGKYLGKGANGIAYEIDNERIFKLTTDVGEADAASKLIRAKPQYLAKVFGLYKIVDTENEKQLSAFAIIQENIQDKPKSRFSELENIINIIKPNGNEFHEILFILIKPNKFNQEFIVDAANKILTGNPEANISEQVRKEAYNYLMGLLNIRNELIQFGIKSTDYVEKGNLGYKDGVLKYFDYGGYFGVTEPNIGNNVIYLPEDGTSKFSTDNALGQDEFPVYNQNDTSPLTDNNIPTTNEDLEYHHASDATKDEFVVDEGRKKAWMPGAQAVGVKKKCQLGGLGNTSAACNQGDIRNLELSKIVEDVIYNFVNENEIFSGKAYRVESNLLIGGKTAGDVVRYERDELENVDDFAHITDEKLAELDKYPARNIVWVTKTFEDAKRYSTEPDFSDIDEFDLTGEIIAEDGDGGYLVFTKGNSLNEERVSFNKDFWGWISPDDRLIQVPKLKHAGYILTQYKNEPYGWDIERVFNKALEDGWVRVTYEYYSQQFRGDLNINGFTKERVVGVFKKFFADMVKYGYYTIYLEWENPAKEHLRFNTRDTEGKMKLMDYISEEIDAKEAFTDKGALKTLLNGKRDVAFIEMTKGNMGKIQKYGLGVMPVRITTQGTLMCVIYRDADKGKKLYDFARSHGGYLNDKSADEARYVGRLLGYKEETIEEYVRRKYGNKIPVLPEPSPDDYDDLAENLDYNQLNRGVFKDEPIHVSDFPLQDLTVSKRGMFGAIQDIKQGRPSQTNEPVLVFYNITNKTFLVEDGYHRVAQAYLNKEKTISVDIYSDMWSDYVANVSPENKFNLSEAELMSLQQLPFKEEIQQLGGKIFSVGGAVRDEFLGKESKDLDVLITGVPMDKLEQILSKYGRVDAVGKSFGILKFKPKGATEEIDIAIPRTEKPSGEGGHKGFDVTSDHALPIEKDLERRDFTINAIAKDIDGNIVDPYGGQKDLQNKTIRVVNPEAFSDDPLRMLRAVQFASRFGFKIEPETMKMIQNTAGRIREIPAERILTEFDKIVKKGDKFTGAFLLKQTGLLKNIFGKDAGLLMGQNIWENAKTMGEFVWLLSHNLVPNPAEFYKNKLRGDIDTYKEIKALQMAFDSGEATNMVEARAVASNMYALSPQTLQSQIIPNVIKTAAQELLTGKYPKGLGELAVNGNDLMQLGLEGKAIGDMLKSMLLKVYSGKIRNNREDLLALTGQNGKMIKEETSERIEYGCLMLFLDVPIWEKITSVIKPEDIYTVGNDYGIEKEPHLTILYGFHDEVTSEEVFKLFKENMPMKPIEVRIKGISVFENPEFDVVKFDVNSPELTKLNGIMRQLPNTTKFPEYRAHITIAYVKKGEGKKYVKPFEKERVLRGDKLVYTWKGHRGSDGETMMLNEFSYDKLNPDSPKDTWDVNGEQVGVDFFVQKYDEWNNQGGKPGYRDPSEASVLEFIQNNYEDFTHDEKLKRQLYWALTDREVLSESKTKSDYQVTKESLMRSKSIGKEMKEEILKYLAGGSTYHEGGVVNGLRIPKVEGKSFDGVSMGADKDGFFVYTHRARSKSHASPDKIPIKEIKFIESTG